MKGRPVSDAEKVLHDRIAQMGCVACRKLGIINIHVSIHHVHGRTEPGCHMHVLPLCGPHHQDDGTALAVHPWKKRWEAAYGKQDDLVGEQWRTLGVPYTPHGQRARTARKPAQKNPAQPKAARSKPTYSKRPVAPKAKPAPTAEQVAYLESRKAEQKIVAKTMRKASRVLRAERELEYREANKDKIEAQKDKQREAQRQYRADCAAAKKAKAKKAPSKLRAR